MAAARVVALVVALAAPDVDAGERKVEGGEHGGDDHGGDDGDGDDGDGDDDDGDDDAGDDDGDDDDGDDDDGDGDEDDDGDGDEDEDGDVGDDGDDDGDGDDGWEVRLAWGNDLFSELPPADDAGLTNDLDVAIVRVRARGALAIGGAVRHRMITERGGERRWDLLDVVAVAARDQRRDALVARVTGRAGVSAAGDLGGRALQDGWHGLTGTGPTLEQGLQHRYDGDRRVALLLGARGEVRHTGDAVEPYATLDGQVALGGTGLLALELCAGARVVAWRGRLIVSVEGGGLVQDVLDDNLALPGGHGRGAHLLWRLGLDAGSARTRVGWQYRADESGSGEPIGVLWLALRR